MSAIGHLKRRIAAQVAAASSGWPGKDLEIVLVAGQDGAGLTIAYLAKMLRRAGEQVGVITGQYVEVAGQRAPGSDQANVLGDSFRLQRLLAQMKRASCNYVLIGVPSQLPVHTFAGLSPALVVVRRCGDAHVAGAELAQRTAQTRRLLGLVVAAND